MLGEAGGGWLRVALADSVDGFVFRELLREAVPDVVRATERCAGDVDRLANGAAPIPALGSHTLIVENGTAEDAMVKLKRHDGTDAIALYVHAYSTARFGSVPDGTYRVVFARGAGWSSVCGRFAESAGVSGFGAEESFAAERVGGTVCSSELRLTLHKVAGGNASVVSLPEDTF